MSPLIRQIPRARHLLFLVTEDWYFVSHRLDIARAAMAAGWRVTVATRVQKHAQAIRETGCELVELPWSRRESPWRVVRAQLSLIALYRELKPDVVHHVALKPIVLGAWAARLARIPRVVNAVAGLGHVFSGHSVRERLLRPLLKAALRNAFSVRNAHVIVQNPEDRDVVHSLGCTEEQVSLIRGAGVDLTRFVVNSEPAGTPVVLMPCRMLWSKGVGVFVDAARLLKERGVDARFVLVGAPDTDNVDAVPESQLREWEHEGVVQWWGHRADMPAVLSSASIVCLPSSYGEGVPKVLLEAAAAGRAIVTTDAPGCREVVEHELTGFLVPERNPLALANALQKLCENPMLRSSFGARARAKAADEFDVTSVASRTLQIYRAA